MNARSTFRLGIAFAVGSALTFGMSGPFAKALMAAGWTPNAAVTARLAGAALALIGTVVVLDAFSGPHIDVVGVGWALGAAICAACYFVLSDRVTADGSSLNSVTLAAGGLVAGAAAVAALGMAGVLPLTFTTNHTVMAGHPTSFLVPVVVLGVVSTAIAYTLGISGVARLRPSYASLMGLGEVLCAVVIAWLLLGEAITPTQAMGGAVVLLGLALAGYEDREPADVVARASWPDAGPVTVESPRSEQAIGIR